MPNLNGRVISTVCLLLGAAIEVVSLLLIWIHQSGRYFPLLLAGFILCCLSTPFYYYYKAKAKTPTDEAVMRVFNSVERRPSEEKQHNLPN